MKYQFNEQELLSLFYDKDNEMRPDLAAPYLKKGYVCATDAHILIRIKAEMLIGKYKEIQSCNISFPADNCDFIVSLQDIETALSNIPQIEEEEKIGKDIDCEECDGEGVVEWEYRCKRGQDYCREFECPVCEGSGYKQRAIYKKTGNMVPDKGYPIGIRKVVFKTKYIEILGKTMRVIGVDKVRCVYQDYGEPCVFRVDNNIEIIIMPCMSPNRYYIHGKDVKYDPTVKK